MIDTSTRQGGDDTSKGFAAIGLSQNSLNQVIAQNFPRMWAGVNANSGWRDGRKEGSNEYKQDGGLLGLVRERRGDKGLMSAYGFVPGKQDVQIIGTEWPRSLE